MVCALITKPTNTSFFCKTLVFSKERTQKLYEAGKIDKEYYDASMRQLDSFEKANVQKDEQAEETTEKKTFFQKVFPINPNLFLRNHRVFKKSKCQFCATKSQYMRCAEQYIIL